VETLTYDAGGTWGVPPAPPPAERSARTVVANLAIVFGVCLTMIGAAHVVGAAAYTKQQQEALRHRFEVERARRMHVRAASLGDGIARLRIPRLGLDVIVVEGVDLADLKRGPGHYRSSAAIGAAGTTAIAGHSSGWGAPFMPVGRLRSGDRVVIDTRDATYTYRITTTRIVDANAAWVLRGDPASRATHKLVLTTCWPLFTSRERLVVWGDLISSVPAF
jgi:sortase A